MKITINTKEDSKDEIKQAIRLLQSLLGEENIEAQQKPAAMLSRETPAQENTSLFDVFGKPEDAIPIQEDAQAIMIEAPVEQEPKKEEEEEPKISFVY